MKTVPTVLLACLLLVVSCGKDNTYAIDDAGIANATWKRDNGSRAAGETHHFSFRAAAAWSARSDQTWCRVETPSGGKGTARLTVRTEPNTTGALRAAEIEVAVGSYPPARFRMTQYAKDGAYVEVNEWVAGYMAKNYLWNEAVEQVPLDRSLDYGAFLRSILTGVAAQKDAEGRDINYDDGYWSEGRRVRFYSYIEGPALRSAASTRAAAARTDPGFWQLKGQRFTTDEGYIYGFSVYGVVPGSAADAAGIRRGMLLTEVDGERIHEYNMTELGEQLLGSAEPLRVVANRIRWNEQGRFESLDPLPELTLRPVPYREAPVFKAATAQVGGRKVAYLLYMAFDTDYDESLVETFRSFEGAEELVLDLRYNGGGAVRTSTLLATLILGEAYKGQTYVRLTYNARRTAAGEHNEYLIGKSGIAGSTGSYGILERALSDALGLKRVYVLTSLRTASASELVINGLRGLGIDVRLIGTRTIGKNVGMEGYKDYTVAGEQYTFMPVTFYSANAAGFSAYSDGFAPDVEMDDTKYYPGDFGTPDDPLYALAAKWIASGAKPEARAARVTRAAVPLAGAEFSRPGAWMEGSLVFLDR